MPTPRRSTSGSRVKIEIVRGIIKVGGGPALQDQHQAVEGLIQRGARASLRMQSFVTGLLYVALDFHPDTPISCWGWIRRCRVPTILRYGPIEIHHPASHGRVQRNSPSRPSSTKSLAILKRANTSAMQPELKQALVALADVMTDARQLLSHVDNQVGSAAQTGGDSRGGLQGAGDLTRDVGRPEAGGRSTARWRPRAGRRRR